VLPLVVVRSSYRLVVEWSLLPLVAGWSGHQLVVGWSVHQLVRGGLVLPLVVVRSAFSLYWSVVWGRVCSTNTVDHGSVHYFTFFCSLDASVGGRPGR
jgi:hypothetical protein